MKTKRFILVILAAASLCGCENGKKNDETFRPERTVIFTIDGMTAAMHERTEMPEFQKLISEGVLYRAVYLPLAAHPPRSADYPWTCSIPNPVMMSGTVFIGQEGIHNNLVQTVFTDRPTAFTVNSVSYVAIRPGFDIYEELPKMEMTPVYPDELAVEAAKRVILDVNPEFMRIHCQGLGSAGSRTREGNHDYTGNIWHPNSPFRRQAAHVDAVLGDFVRWLKDNELWENTVLVVMGDHGQADEGWHAPYAPGNYTTQVLFSGGPVKKGVEYDYAEIIDIVPTIAWLHGLDAPPFSDGRRLEEILPGQCDPETVATPMKDLVEAMLEYHDLSPSGNPVPGLDIEQIGNWHKGPEGADYHAFVRAQVEQLNEWKIGKAAANR